jgi:hypothetical protein
MRKIICVLVNKEEFMRKRRIEIKRDYMLFKRGSLWER